MWLKKLKTVSAELRTSAPSGDRGNSAKAFSGLIGAPSPARPRPSLPPFPSFVIGHPQIIEAHLAS